MFIAMNRFHVRRGSEAEFEAVWLNREVFIHREPGFVAFQMLKGPQVETHALYVSHTTWAAREAFEAWTRSESFRAAHKGAGENQTMYLAPPTFEAFDVIQHPVIRRIATGNGNAPPKSLELGWVLRKHLPSWFETAQRASSP